VVLCIIFAIICSSTYFTRKFAETGVSWAYLLMCIACQSLALGL